MRPTYENPSTLTAEAEVRALLESRWRATAQKLPRSYGCDFAMLREERIQAIVEIKCRDKHDWRLFESHGYFLSLHKWMTARALCEQLCVPFLLVVRAGGEVRAHKTDQAVEWDAPPIKWAGRTDRNDPADLEPHVVLLGPDFFTIPA